jgi:hypothetical protein
LLNDGSGQRAAVWDWLKTQPEDETSKELQRQVLSSAATQDPALALRLAANLPRTPAGDAQAQSLALGLLNGGKMLHRLDNFFEQAPERLRPSLADAAFMFLGPETLGNPQSWMARLAQLPEASRAQGIGSIARAWAAQAPEDAIGWVASLPAGEVRAGAVAAIASTWAATDSWGASQWVASMTTGVERDRSVQALVFAIAERFPREAWDWAMSIGDADGRAREKMRATLASSEGWMPQTQRRAPFTSSTMPEKATKASRPMQAKMRGRDHFSQVR